jgi:hypothetical protein
MNHHATYLATLLPRRTSDALTERGLPIGIWYATGSEKSMQQTHHPAATPVRLSKRQGLHTQVLGLDGRTDLLSRRWQKENDDEEDEGEWYSSTPKEATEGGERAGAIDPMMTNPTMWTKSPVREEQVEAIVARGVQLGLTLTTPFVKALF